MATIRGDQNWFFRDDELTGTSVRDFIHGLEGNDRLFGLGGNDFLYGGNGEDRLFGGDDADTLDGGNHNDTMFGGEGNDTLLGGWGDDRMYGGADNDTFRDLNGNDRMDGGTGTDTVDYSEFYGQVIANLSNGTARQEEAIYRVNSGMEFHSIGTDTLVSIENLKGGRFDDRITGSSANNRIEGGVGDDTLNGAGGHDLIVGGLGRDVMTGGTGNDTFLFNTAPTGTTNLDQITDFRPVDDVIHLDDAIFAALERGELDANAFKIVETQTPTGLDADDRIIVSNWNGIVYYDADGSGSQAAVAVVDLDLSQPGVRGSLSAADFFVV